ncbi:MAG: glucose 1-dehydrogenase [Ruminococcaceae bacterium]|nr:glucose 1-dehydrogenase [Oscillospiraceae bacterium]
MRKSVIITGASRGIGKATALTFAKNGYDVLLCYQSREEEAKAAAEEAKAFGVRAIPFQMDVSSLSDCRRTAAKALMEFGKIDALVCNAGIALPKLFTQTEEEEFDRLFDVNTKGVFFLSQAVAKEMIAAGGGAIVTVSSMWGIAGASGEVAYSASKAAVIGMTKALAKELAPSGIRVNCVAPGVVDTEMNACYDEEAMEALAEKTPLGRIADPEEIAKAIFFLASENASFITGQTLTADGGFLS